MEKNLNIRVPAKLYDDFTRVCAENYTNKSTVVKQFIVEYVRKNQNIGGNKMEDQMTYSEMVEEARKRALHSGTFTDDPEEAAGDVYLVKDIDLVIKAFLKDIEEGDTAEYSEPAEFLDKHGIEWE